MAACIAPMPITVGAAIEQVRDLDRKFRKSCSEILVLNNRIDDLQKRYNRAMKENRRASRYSLRLQLSTVEGVRNMFYEYANRCADRLEAQQLRIIDAGGGMRMVLPAVQGAGGDDADVSMDLDSTYDDGDVDEEEGVAQEEEQTHQEAE